MLVSYNKSEHSCMDPPLLCILQKCHKNKDFQGDLTSYMNQCELSNLPQIVPHLILPVTARTVRFLCLKPHSSGLLINIEFQIDVETRNLIITGLVSLGEKCFSLSPRLLRFLIHSGLELLILM
ncbi:unnamed protein product [Prunus armeniaca]